MILRPVSAQWKSQLPSWMTARLQPGFVVAAVASAEAAMIVSF
jgi:hypothetical protein